MTPENNERKMVKLSFPVDINSSQSVGELKEAIKAKKQKRRWISCNESIHVSTFLPTKSPQVFMWLSLIGFSSR